MLKFKKKHSIEFNDIKEKYQIPFWLEDFQVLIPIKTKWKASLIQLMAGLRILYYLSQMDDDETHTNTSQLHEYIVLYKSNNLKQVIHDIIKIEQESIYLSFQEVGGIITISTVHKADKDKVSPLLDFNRQIIEALDKDENTLKEYFKGHFNNFEMTP